MVEEFDTIQSLNFFQLFSSTVLILMTGILLEVGLRFGRRWALSRNYTWLPAMLNALTWQPIFWGMLLGIGLSLLTLIERITGWERGIELIWTILMISVTVTIVRLINGLIKILTATTPSVSVTLLNNVLTGMGLLIVSAFALGFLFNVSSLLLLLAIVGGITGLTVVFQEPLNNLVSGVSLTVSKRLEPGNWIRLPSGIEGRVMDIQWDVTIVRQLANNFIILPNKSMTDAEIINFDRPESKLLVGVAVGVSYESDLRQVEQVTLDEANRIMAKINGDTPTAEPLIRYNTFADFSINFNVFLWAAKYDAQFLLKHEFIKRLHRRYNEEGIVIPFPIRTLDIPTDQPPAIVLQVPAKEVDRHSETTTDQAMEA